MADGKSLCGEEQVGVSVDDDGVPRGGAQGGQACPHHPPSSCSCCLHPCCRPGNVLEIPLKTLLQVFCQYPLIEIQLLLLLQLE